MRAGRFLGVAWWRLLIHDWSKFTPIEWRGYAERHATGRLDGPHWDRATLTHNHRNPHHWEYWVFNEFGGTTRLVRMPERFAREMVADWMAASRVRHGTWDVRTWYAQHRDAIALHPNTRPLVEALVERSVALHQLMPAAARRPRSDLTSAHRTGTSFE